MEKVFWDRLGRIGLAEKWSTQLKEKIKQKHRENS
jgi:predicted DNA-binding ribbon-helix-helix protein